MSRDFLSLANELSMLPPELAEQLTAEATRTGESPETLIARRGLLSAVQMDIVQTLLRPTDVVPGYELLTAIGHGGMGVVYRARQKTLDRVVAIKTILVNQITDRSMAARFEQEARAVARLKHPNIIAAIDFGQHDGRLYFVMELVDGEDLETRIERQHKSGQGGSATESLAWGVARQTASGLSHAAEQGVVHRDIKPANLLLVEPPAGFPLPPGMPLVKIADFGLAFLATTEADAQTRLTSANTTVGSPHYIAPEQISGEQVDARADIYSLGATIFHLLAGRPPYTGRPLMQILSQKVSAEAPRLRSVRGDITDATDTLVADMMARRPDDRIASYSELLSRIDEVWQSLNAATVTDLPAASLTLTAAWPRNLGSATASDVAHSSGSTRTATLGMPAPIRVTGTLVATQPVPAAIPTQKHSRRVWLSVAGVAVLGGVTAWAIRPRTETPVLPRLVPSGWSEPLFNGRSLRSWAARSGTWVLADDEESAKMLAGTNGVIARRLLRPAEPSPRPLTHFELSFAVRMHKASTIEVHFGMLATTSDDSPRLTIRLESQSAAFTHRSADRSLSQPATTPLPLTSVTADQPRVVRLRRDATHWIASVDGQRIGTMPLAGHAEHPEFRLSVEGGPAWFSDIEVEELVEPQLPLKSM